jgi:hypothetical protein
MSFELILLIFFEQNDFRAHFKQKNLFLFKKKVNYAVCDETNRLFGRFLQ